MITITRVTGRVKNKEVGLIQFKSMVEWWQPLWDWGCVPGPSALLCPEAAAQQGGSHIQVLQLLPCQKPSPWQTLHPCVSRIYNLRWFPPTGKGGRGQHREGELHGRLLHQTGLGGTMCPRGRMLWSLRQNGNILHFWGTFWWGCSKSSFHIEGNVIFSGF